MSLRSRSRLAIALLSCTLLLYEIAITRVLSVVLWYHWAFLSISLAMLGLGAPGVWLSLARRPARALAPLCAAAGALLPLSVIAIVKLGGAAGALRPLFAALCMLPPLLCLGGAICALLIEAEGAEVGRAYAADLAGACVGAAAVIPLLALVPTPQLVGALGLGPLGAHALIRRGPSRVTAIFALALCAALIAGSPFRLRHTKVYEERAARAPVYERWTPTARLAFFDSVFWVADPRAGFAWGRGRRARPAPATQWWVEQDGAAGTALPRFRGRLEELRHLLDDVTSVGLELRAPRSVAIVGAGGGRDILASLLVGARRVEAIELNGALVAELGGRFRWLAGGVYELPGVRAVIGEARSHLARSAARHDLIQIALTDSWAATAAGAFALSENNLYTLEAFRLYRARLSARGLLATSRWLLGPLGIEVPRLAYLAQQALARDGVARPNDHLAVVAAGWVGTVLVARAPFSRDERARLAAICRARGFDLLYPGAPSPVRRILEGGPAAIGEPRLRLEPPTDDRPFFFQTLSPFARPDRELAARHGTNAEAVYSLQLLALATATLALALFFAPFALARALVRHPGFWRGSAYFFGIGGAFMLVELPWLQKLILYLGHPSYAATTALGCLLLGASLGAASSARLGLARGQRLLLALAPLVAGVTLALGPLVAATLGAPLALRVALCALALVPAAFVMGLCFPLGMLRFGDGNKPWFWALNGAAAVLASVLSCALAIELGFTRVALVGAALYAAAALLLRGEAERPAPDWSI